MSSALPMTPRDVLDNSIIQTHQGCPRKAYYQYWLNRAPGGLNFPIQFGIAYHKYREVLEGLYLERSGINEFEVTREFTNDAHRFAMQQAEKGWKDPPTDHKRAYLNVTRLRRTLTLSYERWLAEKESGRIVVIHTERPFDLELPSGRRYGGRFDQLLKYNGRLWIRDFKTTGRMGQNYAKAFDPNSQMTGYIWGASQLAGQEIEGVIIEVVYNTKTKGPEFFQFLTTRSQFQIDSWLEGVETEMDTIETHIKTNIWPQRTNHCLSFGLCAFQGACQQSSWYSIDDWLGSSTISSTWDFMNPEDEEGIAD